MADDLFARPEDIQKEKTRATMARNF